ncbi:guanylate cyclase 2G-like protein [Labeo rohita]|uniref:Guanylate cyclase 2G-like protein n=1 Tax=Labeo rohita TaxID=84645 RepID=A0A498LQN1_LABRO|nr:guanylate cyclase 2G-like protein [Labeo rohita]
MVFASSVWGKNTLPSGSRESASTAIFYRSKCFVHGSLFSKTSEPQLPRFSPGGRVSIWLRRVRLVLCLCALDVDLFDYRGFKGTGLHDDAPGRRDARGRSLSHGSSSSLKKPMLPTKPCRLTSSLVGKAYQAAGQAGAALHTMAVLQAYQADLLKDLSTDGTIDEEAFLELRRATDLSLRATKQTARPIGRSMAAMVSTERHLGLNLTGIKERDRSLVQFFTCAQS